MSKIEKIKHGGAVRALKDTIRSLEFKLTQRNWSSTMDANGFCRMGEAIKDARGILDEMEETLAALQEIEPSNK